MCFQGDVCTAAWFCDSFPFNADSSRSAGSGTHSKESAMIYEEGLYFNIYFFNLRMLKNSIFIWKKWYDNVTLYHLIGHNSDPRSTWKHFWRNFHFQLVLFKLGIKWWFCFNVFVPMSIRLDASSCAKKWIITGGKWAVFIIQQTYWGVLFFYFIFSMKELAVFTSISMATV